MLKNKEEIKQWLNSHDIDNYTINEDLTVDVNGSVYLKNQFTPESKEQWLEHLEELEEHLDYENRHEYELCDDGSYERDGSYYIYEEEKFDPYEIPVQFGKVDGDFYINENKLKNLNGCPTHVGGDFECQSSGLVSLEGAPKYVGGHFHASDNELTSLIGAPLK